MATIWRGGCIIRARFLNRIKEAYDARPDLPLLLADDYFADAVADGAGGLAAGGRRRRAERHPDARRSPRRWPTTTGSGRERLPAALIQGQRDFFGAHTYRRVDKAGTFHTDVGRRPHREGDAMTTTQTPRTSPPPPAPYRIGGDLPVVRLGYGTMQLPGEGVWGAAEGPRRRARACCAAPSRSA